MSKNVWCRHYRAPAYHDTCEIGIEFQSVRDTTLRPFGLPCTEPQHAHLCPSRESYTDEEIAEQEAQITAFITGIHDLSERRTDKCPHCGKQITTMKQVGRC